MLDQDRPARRERHVWRPRTVAHVAVPLLLVLVISEIDKQQNLFFPGHIDGRVRGVIDGGVLLASIILAVYAVRSFTHIMSRALDDYLPLAQARTLATFTSVVLYAIIALIVIDRVGHNLSGFLVGGALTGVVLGIAGQASLSNIIAGLVILFARPYSAGMFVTARAAQFGGAEYNGQVWDITLFYTILHSGDQEVRIPNSAMVGAVVVLRPQESEVYIELTLSRTTDLPEYLDRLHRAVEESTPARRVPHVTLQSVTEAGYVVGVRVFVASEDERREVERVIAGMTQERDPDDGATEQPRNSPDTVDALPARA